MINNPISNHPNIDYSNLSGDEFKRYLSLIDQLAPTDEPIKETYEFDEFNASPAFDSSNRLVGVILRDKDPIRTIRIEVRDARMHNRQIENAQSRATGGKYLLLKQESI